MIKQSKGLYIDTPFINEKGGDKNRSRFLWKTLDAHYSMDLLLLTNCKSKADKKALVLPYEKPKRLTQFFQPSSLYVFSKKSIQSFKTLIQEKRYRFLFFRFGSMLPLAKHALKVSPDIKVICDFDMLQSHLMQQLWQVNPSFSNRYAFKEMVRWKLFEKKVFSLPYLFFLSNKKEKEMLSQKHQKQTSFIECLPNVAPSVPRLSCHRSKESYILFYGNLKALINQDAMHFLFNDIYPKIEKALIEQNVKLCIAGKNSFMWQRFIKTFSQASLLGEVEDIYQVIKGARFVVLPLRVCSGTCTRFLESAACEKMVVTTFKGVEGIDGLDKKAFFVDSAPKKIALKIIEMLQNDKKVKEKGKRLKEAVLAYHSESQVANKLISFMEDFLNH